MWACIYMYMYIFMYIYSCIYICIYICIYKHMKKSSSRVTSTSTCTSTSTSTCPSKFTSTAWRDTKPSMLTQIERILTGPSPGLSRSFKVLYRSCSANPQSLVHPSAGPSAFTSPSKWYRCTSGAAGTEVQVHGSICRCS